MTNTKNELPEAVREAKERLDYNLSRGQILVVNKEAAKRSSTISDLRIILTYLKQQEISKDSTPQHVCGLQGFGALEDKCPACEAYRKDPKDV
jgi:hypothetical protein